MKSTIKLNDDVELDIHKMIQGRIAALANSGGGKSWLIRRIAEQADGKIQTIILDPEGEFSTLREKFDFILCGKDQDVPVETRSAGMLATMLLEARASAVIDLFELHPKERQAFVKIFCETMVNAPKNLHHPVLVILDEAHDFVPEGKPSEATYAVESLASKGRKRDYCLMLVSQRIAKISKDAISECGNVLFGKATWANDRKRTAEELGLTNKEEILDLKKLPPGTFYAVGPAISGGDLVKFQVGSVQTTHGRTSYTEARPIPPSAQLKKALAKLANLPKEAQKEAQTVAELKKENAELRRHRCAPGADPATIQKAIDAALTHERAERFKEQGEWKRQIENWFKILAGIGKSTEAALKDYQMPVALKTIGDARRVFQNKPIMLTKNRATPVAFKNPEVHIYNSKADISQDLESGILTGPEQRILDAIAWMFSIGNPEPEQTAVAFLADYTYGGGAFNNPKARLKGKGLVEYRGDRITLTDAGHQLAKPPTKTLSTADLHEKVLHILPSPEKKLLQVIIAAYPGDLSNEEVAEQSGYVVGSGGFNNPKGRLRSLGLIEYPAPGRLKAKSLLFL